MIKKLTIQKKCEMAIKMEFLAPFSSVLRGF
jgi:hypothetical protein